jgi:hypothetical protein
VSEVLLDCPTELLNCGGGQQLVKVALWILEQTVPVVAESSSLMGKSRISDMQFVTSSIAGANPWSALKVTPTKNR